MKLLLIIAALVLTGCNATVPKSPQEIVFEAKAAHAVALRTAVAYRELPPCNPAPQPCHDPAVVDQLRRADKVADAALDAAENVVRAPGFSENVIGTAVKAAQEALNAFTAIVATLNVKR